jgi:hypothetical protein
MLYIYLFQTKQLKSVFLVLVLCVALGIEPMADTLPLQP